MEHFEENEGAEDPEPDTACRRQGEQQEQDATAVSGDGKRDPGERHPHHDGIDEHRPRAPRSR